MIDASPRGLLQDFWRMLMRFRFGVSAIVMDSASSAFHKGQTSDHKTFVDATGLARIYKYAYRTRMCIRFILVWIIGLLVFFLFQLHLRPN